MVFFENNDKSVPYTPAYNKRIDENGAVVVGIVFAAVLVLLLITFLLHLATTCRKSARSRNTERVVPNDARGRHEAHSDRNEARRVPSIHYLDIKHLNGSAHDVRDISIRPLSLQKFKTQNLDKTLASLFILLPSGNPQLGISGRIALALIYSSHAANGKS